MRPTCRAWSRWQDRGRSPRDGGSQFFVVTGADIGLPAEYAFVGTVTAGLETVLAIEALGTGDGPPSRPVVLERVTVQSE